VYTQVVGRDAIAEQAALVMWGLLTAALFCCSFRSNVALSTLFAFLAVLFFLIGASKNPQSEKIQFVSAIWGVLTAIIAFYAGFGELMNETYRLSIVPLGSFVRESIDEQGQEQDQNNATIPIPIVSVTNRQSGYFQTKGGGGSIAA